MTVAPDGGGRKALTADLMLGMGAAGMRSEVLRPEGGEGLSLALKGDARFTRTSSASTAGLAANDGGAGNGFQASGRLEGEVGYGLRLFGDRFTGTPNVGFGLSDGGVRDYRIGWQLTSAVPGDPGFEVSLDATRRGLANDGKPEHGVTLRAAIRW